jgi:hypothetical protein
MIKFLLVFIFFFTIDTTFAVVPIEKELKQLANEYILSILNKDETKYKSLITKKYLDEQTKNNFLKETFSKKVEIEKKKKKIDFDFKFKKAAVTKNKYLINIKEKTDANFDENWFIAIKEKNSKRYKIHSIQHMED